MIRIVVPPRGRRSPRGEIGLGSGKTLVVVSPHLDDAALSLGATLAEASRTGLELVNLTVFAGDPNSTAPPGNWDRKTGFSSAGAVARARRVEDAAACALLGMSPVWLPFPDYQYTSDRSEVWPAIKPALERADMVLIPGFPLAHPDHRWLSELIRDHEDALPELGFYVEQPYAEWEWFGQRRLPGDRGSEFTSRPVNWIRSRGSAQAWLRKQRACRAYKSQLGAMARPAERLLARIALYELGRGGEALGFSAGVPKAGVKQSVPASGTAA
jgi:LmbE family N-acetylglucosaminyl deacetylase